MASMGPDHEDRVELPYGDAWRKEVALQWGPITRIGWNCALLKALKMRGYGGISANLPPGQASG